MDLKNARNLLDNSPISPLPNEILIKILNYLSLNDLKIVILINAEFYNFVKENLSQRFSLKVDHTREIFKERTFFEKFLNTFIKKKKFFSCTANAILLSSRQLADTLEIGCPEYCKSDLSSHVQAFATCYVEKFGKSLKMVTINGKTENSFIIPILCNLPNVESLTVSNIRAKKAVKPYNSPEFLKLTELTYDSFFSCVDDDFLNVFEKVTTLRRVEIKKSKFECRFMKFLCNQTRLKELQIKTSGSREFLKRFGENCPFTLKKFWISDKSFYEQDFFLLANFLRNQSKIKDLKIEVGLIFDPILCKAILNLPKLTNLSIDVINWEPKTDNQGEITNTSVKNLQLNISSLELATKYPSVETLTLIAYKDDIVPSVSLDELKDLKDVVLEVNVTSLKFFINLQLSGKLKELVLNHVFGTDQGWKAIFLNNPNIEILKMVNCGFNDEHKIIEDNAPQFKSLKKLYCSYALGPELINGCLKKNCINLEQIWSQLGRIQVAYTKIYQK